MKIHHAVAASDDVYGLAEGPLWDAERREVLWVDINVGHVHVGELRDGHVKPTRTLDFAGTVGAVLRSERGELLVAEGRGLTTVAVNGSRSVGPQLVPTWKPSRLNDAACDPAGQVLVGSLALDERVGDEVLVRVGASGDVAVVDDDLSLSNGIAWSPDGATLYNVDTLAHLVYARPYDAATGATGARRVLLQVDDGLPDGLCVDTDGDLWIAVWGAGQVRRHAADGALREVVEVPAPHPSSAAFVGPDLDVLLITTASEQLTDRQRAAFPDSGRLFTCDVGTTGARTTPWAGP